MTKINPKTARAMYKAASQGNKDKIAQETYGEFGFDTLSMESNKKSTRDILSCLELARIRVLILKHLAKHLSLIHI